MPIVINFPVLAADAWGTLISIAFLVIAFIGWIMNLVNQNQPPQPVERGRPPRRPPRPQERKLQSEIDLFLEEVSGRRPEAASIEVFEQAEEADIRVSTGNESRPPKPRRKPVGSGIKQRQLSDSGQLERGMHDQAADRRESHRLADVGRQTGARGAARRAESDQGLFREDPEVEVRREGSQFNTLPSQEPKAGKQQAFEHLQQPQVRASSLAALLRDPAGMRQAIVLAEILKRPRGLSNT